jgi:hypothetical protein
MTVSLGTTPSSKDIIQIADVNHTLSVEEITKLGYQQDYDLRLPYGIASPCKSDGTDIKGIQRTIKNIQSTLTTIQKYSNLQSALSELTKNDKKEPGKTIKKVLAVATSDIAGYVKNIIGRVRGWVLTRIQNEAKKILPYLFPGEVPSFVDKLDKGINGLSCAFAKIVRGLMATVGNLLLDIVDKYVNGPLCLIEDFIGNLLRKIMNPIQNAINNVLSLLGTATDAIGNITGNIFNMLDFTTGILNFFKCDDDKECPDQHEINRAGGGFGSGPGGDPQGKPPGGISTPSDGARTSNAYDAGQGFSGGSDDPNNFKIGYEITTPLFNI